VASEKLTDQDPYVFNGQTAEIRYDPMDPAEAVLRPQIDIQWSILLVGVNFFGGGFLFIAIPWLS
jgi:hypothetical protein